MKINKRECRKHASAKLSYQDGEGLLHPDQIKYIICSTTKNIGGRRVLILYFYERKNVLAGDFLPCYTLFQTKDDYTTLEHLDGGKTRWRSSCLYNFREVFFLKICAFYSAKDESIVSKFCNNQKNGFQALQELQSTIMNTRLDNREKTRQRNVSERMKPIPHLPRDFRGWLHREVIPAYIFYQYHKSKKPMTGHCTACKKDVLVVAKHNLAGKCPKCKRSITFKAIGLSKNVWHRHTAQVLQKCGNELILRVIKISNSYSDFREPKFTMRETIRVFINWDKKPAPFSEPYYYSYNDGCWKSDQHPRYSHYQYFFEDDMCGYLYSRNLDYAISKTPWQYSQLEKYYCAEKKPLEIFPYLNAYIKYPAIEYLVKLKLFNLTKTIIYGYGYWKTLNLEGKNLIEILGIDPQDLSILTKLNITIEQLELYKELKKVQIKPIERLLSWYHQKNIKSIKDLLFTLGFTSPIKLINYLDKQFDFLSHSDNGQRYSSINTVLTEYKDYLKIGKLMDYDFKNSFVLFPKDLPKVHDQLSSLFNEKKMEIFDTHIQNLYNKCLEQHQFTKYGFTLIPPKTALEIIQEGHVLHHCVGSYVEQVALEKSTILFLRRVDNLDYPFYTIELQDQKIIQVHGRSHSLPTPEVEKFLKAWDLKVLRRQPVKNVA